MERFQSFLLSPPWFPQVLSPFLMVFFEVFRFYNVLLGTDTSICEDGKPSQWLSFIDSILLSTSIIIGSDHRQFHSAPHVLTPLYSITFVIYSSVLGFSSSRFYLFLPVTDLFLDLLSQIGNHILLISSLWQKPTVPWAQLCAQKMFAGINYKSLKIVSVEYFLFLFSLKIY